MTEDPITRASRVTRSLLDDPGRLAVVVGLVLASLLVLRIARNSVVAPIDDLITERVCTIYGNENERILTAHERSNRFGLVNRSEGSCSYGPGDNGEAAVTVPLADIDAGLMLSATKIMGIILQFGIVSIFLRLVVDPVMGFYRLVRDGTR